MAHKLTRTDYHEIDNSSPVTEGVTITEVFVNTPYATRQEYPEVNAAIDRGLADVAAGRVHKRCSYAEYADIEIEN